LIWLCMSGSNAKLAAQKTKLYRLTEFIGRWSMVDVFVVAVLVALIQMGNIMSIHPGLGALAFAGMVIVTVFAADSFDPRLMWDAQNKRKH
jgi:paraquat-inducible protein A